jgi:hypothetical protein
VKSEIREILILFLFLFLLLNHCIFLLLNFLLNLGSDEQTREARSTNERLE